MPPKSKNGRKSTSNPKKVPKPNVPRPRGSLLDQSGAAYARLLADPCNAPLAHPTYAGTEGGYLIRSDAFITTFNGATDTGGYLVFTPSLHDFSNSGLVIGTGSSSSATATAGSYGALVPGRNFMTANASAFRCVAACLKVSYPGSESGRSGRIHYGHLSSGAVLVGTAYTPDNVAQLLPCYERTPGGHIEITWKPNDADQLFSRPNDLLAADTAKNNKSASLAVVAAGLPAGVGLTFHMTAVYEWQPASGLGISVPDLNKTPSNNTLDEVINYLIKSGHTFLKSTAMSAGRTISMAALTTAYGLMDPRISTRRLAF